MNWFNINDLRKFKIIDTYNSTIRGYVLPHAGTKYTGHILSHTLRFIPNNYFSNILILYYPANNHENIIFQNQKYYHEYYVLMKTLKYFTENIWKFGEKNITGINVRDNNNINFDYNNTLIIVSADFSHFLPLQEAIVKENCAAHSLLHRKFDLECTNVVDTIETFKLLYNNLPNNNYLQWIGRTRSPGIKGVGYLSFLIKKPQNIFKIPDGIFITAYDKQMRQRECLGEWFDTHKYNKTIQNNLLNKVINLARTTSRLTGGNYLNIPINNYTITYLYKDSAKKFIRGYHGIKGDAFYLPDVMLENSYDNGKWIKKFHQFWPKSKNFKINNTLKKIREKAGNLTKKYKTKKYKTKKYKTKKYKQYKLYFSDVYHGKIN